MQNSEATVHRADGVAMVEVRGVDYSFGSRTARRQVLYDCHLDLFPGEVVIMTGPSGSGKTTLLTLIGALRTLQRGSISLLGESLQGMSPRQLQRMRRQIGFIFQDHNLFEALTARQTLSLAMELQRHRYLAGEFETRPLDMLNALGLEAQAESRPGQLSTGQKQRIAIGRALINRPQLVLADEPTAALDSDSGAKVMGLLRRHADENGAAILIVTHDPRIIDSADRVVEMLDGKVVSGG